MDIHIFPASFKAHSGAIKAIGLSTLSPKYIVTGGADCAVRIWDTETQQCLAQFIGHTSIISWYVLHS